MLAPKSGNNGGLDAKDRACRDLGWIQVGAPTLSLASVEVEVEVKVEIKVEVAVEFGLKVAVKFGFKVEVP